MFTASNSRTGPEVFHLFFEVIRVSSSIVDKQLVAHLDATFIKKIALADTIHIVT